MIGMETLELPETVYEALVRAARESGSTPAEWVAARLPPNGASGDGKPEPTEDEIRAANARLRATIVSYGSPIGTDNEAIDADLAREYGDDHADLYRAER
jgi:hypothetical protein